MIFFSEGTQPKQNPLIPRYHLRVFEVHDTAIKWINCEHVRGWQNGSSRTISSV